MKKTLAKILSIASLIVGSLFISILLLITFSKVDVAELNNSIVKSVLILMTVLFGFFSFVLIGLVFKDTESLSEVAIFDRMYINTSVTKTTVVKMTKKHLKDIQGVKVKKTSIYLTKQGIQLRINVKTADIEIDKTVMYMKELLVDVFKREFGIRLSDIQFKIDKIKSSYSVDRDKAMKVADKKYKESLKDNKVADEKEDEVASLVKDAYNATLKEKELKASFISANNNLSDDSTESQSILAIDDNEEIEKIAIDKSFMPEVDTTENENI